MDTSLFTHARAGYPVLTVNNRLARLLADQYDRCQANAGQTSWTRPVILSLSAWTDLQLEVTGDLDLLLNRTQCLYVWEQIVDGDQRASGQALLQLAQTARKAHQAHQLLLRHRAGFTINEAAPDHQAFLRWRQQWQETADKHGWRDPAEAIDLIASAVQDGRLTAPQSVVLAGFDELPPDIERLRDALQGGGCTVETWNPPPYPEGHIRRFEDAQDPADEVRCCARWIRNILECDPYASIGVVVPQLETYRNLFDTVFRAELDPESVVVGNEVQESYNLSLPQRLDREGPVRAALNLLLLGRRVELEPFCWLLRTPYLGNAEGERFYRGRLDRRLREDGRPIWTLSQIKTVTERFAKQQKNSRCGVSRMLASCEQGLRTTAKRRPGDWAEAFLNQLQGAGWPGQRTFSSREYQVVEAFQSVFAEMAKLDGVSGPVSRDTALTIFARLVGDSPFQPESPANSVQVLGLLEAGGLSFDYLWVPGLHDGAFPQPPDPNPFIPLAIQRGLQMQRADAERERLFARQVADRLFTSAPEVILSWPLRRDGLAQRPSLLITGYDQASPVRAATAAPQRRIHESHGEIEWYVDGDAPAVHSRKRFSGGTGILKDQALCPFRSFAHFRLRARQLDSVEIGFNNMERGSLAHHALEFFWKEMGNQDALLALEPEALTAQISQSVDKALERFEKEKRRDIPFRQKELEKSRLARLLAGWLRMEAQRQPFRVEATELNHTLEVGGLLIKTRIDRIDELPDRGMAIIDYKTGLTDSSQWFKERITEPQLPLYCLALPRERIAAVLFAQVRSKPSETLFRGILRHEEDAWPGLRLAPVDRLNQETGRVSFDVILEHWRQALDRLGSAFLAGDARVDPVDKRQACQYCDLTPLCRICDENALLMPRESADA